MKLFSIGKAKLPTPYDDPFRKDNVISIRVHFSPSWGNKHWEARGYVGFQSGATKGEQAFTADTFDDCVLQMKAFIDQLQEK